MGTPNPFDLLEDLASSLVMADVDDKPALAQLMMGFEQFVDALPAEVAQSLGEPAREATKLLQNIVMDDTKDPSADFERVSSLLSQIQHAQREPASEDEEEADIPDAEGENAEMAAAAAAEGAFILPDWVDQATFNDFLSNQKAVLEDLESDILDLEKGDTEKAGAIRRVIHTMKGEAGVLGLEDMENLCHAIEDFMDLDLPPSQTADRLLQMTDWVGQAVLAYVDGLQPAQSAADFMAQLKQDAADSQDTKKSKPKKKAKKAASAKTKKAQTKKNAPAEEKPVEKPEPKPARFIEVGGDDDEPDPDADYVLPRPGPESFDDETIAMAGEFLQESEEGLSNADQVLMEIENSGPDDEKINNLFRVFHTIKGVAGFLELKQIESLAHTTETMMNLVRQGNLPLAGAVLDLVFDATEMMRNMLGAVKTAVESGQPIASMDNLPYLIRRLQAAIKGEALPEETLPDSQRTKKLGEILVDEGDLDEQKLAEALESQRQSGRRLGEELVAEKAVSAKKVAQALRSQTQGTKIRETVKVDLERVDSLVEMIGELSIVESMVVNTPEIVSLTSPHVRNSLGQLTKITRDLQSVAMRMRMVPVHGLFQKMARMVRDLSRKNHKNISLVQNGEWTEMDRSMAEQIGDPLVHMIRNAVDHGIEDADERQATGKPKNGTVSLSAYHEGGSIVIEISDDGRGLSRDRILAKALKQGLMKEGEKLKDSEIYNMIFHPGFSTAEKVTEISGRGVGMDVVRRNIEAMRGRVSIDSTPGHGTVFKMVLPLTLAIIDGMLVKCGTETYILPTLSIVESLKPEPSMLYSFTGKGELVNVRGDNYPLLRLNRLFNVSDAKSDASDALVVLVESVGRTIGILVDDVVTQQQVVIKSLGSGMESMKYASGAAILSDGRVGLILNVEEISSLIDDKTFLAETAAASTLPQTPPPSKKENSPDEPINEA